MSLFLKDFKSVVRFFPKFFFHLVASFGHCAAVKINDKMAPYKHFDACNTSHFYLLFIQDLHGIEGLVLFVLR